MKKEELIKLIKSLPADKCLVSIINGRRYVLSCEEVECPKDRRCYDVSIIGNISAMKRCNLSSNSETTLYVLDKLYIYYYVFVGDHESRIVIDAGLYKCVLDVEKSFNSDHITPSNLPMTQQRVDEIIELKEQEKMQEEKKKQDEFNELVSKPKQHFVEFKKDAGISNVTTTTTGKVDTNTDKKKSVIFTDCPRNEKWSDETILNIVNFVNSGILYDEKQYTVVSRAGVGFLGDLADYVLMGHVWDVKNKRALVLKEKHKSYCLFFKNGKHTHCLDIIPNEDIVASYKVEGVL